MAKEYIERGLTIENLKRFAPELYTPLINQIMEKQPAADVVEVVRCKDCKHFAKGMAVGMCKWIKDRPIIPITYNHYCSYGERKEQR